ncbi:MAG: thiol-disulfide oxidoreductase DCC family protein [Ectobacillus sp.]
MLTVFYDGWCPLCMKVAKRTKQLDIRNALEFVSFRERETVQTYRLTSSLLLKMEKRLFIWDGKVWHDGIYACYALAKHIPLYWPLLPFIKLSIWTKTGQRLYDFIASRRFIVPVGHCQAGVCLLENKQVER